MSSLLATDLDALKTEEQKTKWHAFSTTEERTHFIYEALSSWDRTHGRSPGAPH